jgi:hypothetical protein
MPPRYDAAEWSANLRLIERGNHLRDGRFGGAHGGLLRRDLFGTWSLQDELFLFRGLLLLRDGNSMRRLGLLEGFTTHRTTVEQSSRAFQRSAGFIRSLACCFERRSRVCSLCRSRAALQLQESRLRRGQLSLRLCLARRQLGVIESSENVALLHGFGFPDGDLRYAAADLKAEVRVGRLDRTGRRDAAVVTAGSAHDEPRHDSNPEQKEDRDGKPLPHCVVSTLLASHGPLSSPVINASWIRALTAACLASRRRASRCRPVAAHARSGARDRRL